MILSARDCVRACVSGFDTVVAYTHANLCLDACGAGSAPPKPGPPPPPSPPPGPAPLPTDTVVTLTDRYSPFTYEGVWAMSANGAARLLFEYPEPTRGQILDTLFAAGKGTRWQGLKIEIGGDVESSCKCWLPSRAVRGFRDSGSVRPHPRSCTVCSGCLLVSRKFASHTALMCRPQMARCRPTHTLPTRAPGPSNEACSGG